MGINTDIFKAHSVQGTSTMAEVNSNVPLDVVMEMAISIFPYPAPLLHIMCEGTEFYLMFSHIILFQMDFFVYYNPNYTRALKQPVSTTDII